MNEDFKRLLEQGKSKTFAYSKLNEELDGLGIKLSRLQDDLDYQLRSITSMKDDEYRAKEQLATIQDLLKKSKYKLKDSDTELLIYTMTDELSLPLDDLNLELIEESPSLEDNKFLELVKAEDLLERIMTHKRTRDIVLAEESINSWNNLKAAYYAMRNRMLYFPKRIREFITEKYSEIINNYEFHFMHNVDDTRSSSSDTNHEPGTSVR